MAQRGFAPSTPLRGAAAEAAAGATLTAPRPQVSGPAPAGQCAYRAYRLELQGLRALAVILVLCYHVWLGRISGGVDVFFVITGFLIIGQLHRAITRGGIRFGPLPAQGRQLHSERLATAGAVAADDPNDPGAMAIDGGVADMAAYDAEPAPSPINLPYEWDKFSDRECEMSRRGHKMRIRKTTNGATEELREVGPDAVVTMASSQVSKGRTERIPEGFVVQWRKLESAGIPVVAFRDNPRYDFEPSACADDLGAHSPRCSGVRAELNPEVPPYERLSDGPGNVRFVGLSDYFCDGPTCPPGIGNVRVYMDDNHITQTYMNTLAPVLERELTTALGW